ncbi:hypothetical protein [Romboutsia lituseburensis]|uniref:hypothetical protein n=1 Tax=Romboutsia lituseburensis TaxID=1537 RepID=UPI0022EA53BA|nr:hypothetical protein [Romboutsia lituseburensis]
MINKLNSILGKVNSITGVQITPPEPTKTDLQLSRCISLVIGIGGVTLGTICSSKMLLGLGVLCTVSSIATTSELKNLK